MTTTDETLISPSSIFFRRDYAFRSKNGLFALVVFSAFAFLFLWGSQRGIDQTIGPLSGFIATCLLISGIALLAIASYTLIAIAVDRRVNVQVSVDGITRGRTLTAWSDVGRLYGIRYPNGVCLYFAPRSQLIYFERSLSTTPLLGEKEYTELATKLRDSIHLNHPHVAIELSPRIADSE